MRRHRLIATTVAAFGLAAAPAAAAPDPSFAERPMELPGTIARAAAGQPGQWIVGARAGDATAKIARRHGASSQGTPGAYSVPRSKARAFAGELREAGLLTYAEPDAAMRKAAPRGSFKRASAFDGAVTGYARNLVVDNGLVPPPPGNVTIAVVDDLVDLTHPDVGPQSRHLNALPGGVLGSHGTAVASNATGNFNGTGVTGIYPGVPILSWGLPVEISCSDAARGINAVASAKARIINLSFGSESDCFTLYRAVQTAYQKGSLVVASAGNEFASGNPTIYPAAYPHVLSVGALAPNLTFPSFSSESLAVDIGAPGVGVPASIPLAFDTEDGVRDGQSLVDGTSFAAPIVSGAAAWLAAARPKLSNGQIADVLRNTAQDVGPKGYDRGAGFGLVRLGPALAAKTPKSDLLEPNDGISFVDGTAFKKAQRYVYTGKGSKTLRATADAIEDPIDVYRVRVPARKTITISLKPSQGNTDLTVFDRGAKSVTQKSRIIDQSTRTGTKTDTVRLRNNSGKRRSAFVGVDIGSGNIINARYTLRFKR